MTIENIELEDLSELSHLYKELSEKETDINNMIDNFNFIKNNENYILLGAKFEDKLVGSVMGIVCRDLVGKCKPFIVMENMIIDSDYRGIGVGTKLMKSLEELAIKRNCYYIIFVSNSKRKEAHGFYESLGYNLDAVKGFKKYL